MNEKKETKANYMKRVKAHFLRGRLVKLSDHTRGRFLEWGKDPACAIVLNDKDMKTCVTRASLLADNLPRKGFGGTSCE